MNRIPAGLIADRVIALRRELAVDDPEPVFALARRGVVATLVHWLLAMGAQQFLTVVDVQREVQVPL